MTNRTSRRFLALFPSRIGIFFLLTLALSPGPVAAMDADEPGNYPAGPIVLRLPAAVDTVSWDRPEIESAAPSIPIQIRLPPIRPDLATAKAMAPETLNPRRWLRRPVQFDLERRPLPDFLRDFCAAQGVACQVSESLNGGLVTGRFAFDDPGELLDLLAHTQLMNWYFDGVVVFFQAETEMESRFFPMEGRREAGLRQTLTELGLFDERFPWRVADGGRLLMAQGPAVYLNRIAETLFRQTVADAEPTEKTLGVFRLKHAWAAEQTVGTGGSSTRVPGVADLLRRIVDDKGDALWTSPPPVASGTPQMLRGSGTVARRDAQAAAAAAPPAVPAAAPATAALAGAPFIQADARLNAVLVWDYPENLPRHQAIIEALDQPLALVEIRAAILDVEADRTRDLGISWEISNRGGAWNNLAGGNVGSGAGRIIYDSISGDGFQYATIYTRGLDQFMARVGAMEKDGTANVLSRPSVLTQDHIQATLEHTETFYVRLEGEREVDLADITTGLTLRVTPHIVQDQDGRNGVQLVVYLVSGTNTSDTDSAQVDNLPRVRQSTITTQAMVYEDEALVLGGTYHETRRASKTGVPVLKNIPGLGALFRRSNTENTKSERLFVLAPRIIRPGASMMTTGSEAERTMSVSPGREVLDGPAFEDRTPPPDKRLFWRKP